MNTAADKRQEFQVWIDADACPKVIKEILFRAAQRLGFQLTLVANHALTTPPSPFISALQVSSGFDVADDYIVEHVSAGDIVITGDIPLAADLIAKNALVLTPRGERFTTNNIGARLNMRDFMEDMRSTGEVRGGPAPLNHNDRMQFANALDRLLAQRTIPPKSTHKQ
ncbi:MAG: YaiI/YqxD family protein [Halioglobus sp.]